MMSRYGWGGFAPYVSVAERRKKAARKIMTLQKKGQKLQPIILEGKAITQTFWGRAWCRHVESYCDVDNRLSRGRSYVRNGLVIDLQINKGEIKALVSGSAVYKVIIKISALKLNKWKQLVKACSGQIDSLIELLLGKFSNGVMQVMTHPEKGLFPLSSEISLNCSCPDWAEMCKHVAAVIYGVGVRLDEQPESLFLLRQVDHLELISTIKSESLAKKSKSTDVLDEKELSSIFGISIEEVRHAKSG